MDYLHFTFRERCGILTLVVLVTLFALAPRFVCQPRPVSIVISPQQLQQLSRPLSINRSMQKVSDTSAPVRGRPMMSAPVAAAGTAPSHRRPLLKIIDVNRADTTALVALPGIGSRLAARIVLFREKLGGFYSVDQLGEVYGLKEEVLRKLQPLLSCNPAPVRKININSAALEELRQHPYIRWEGARALIRHRDQHGAFGSLRELKQINSLDTSVLSRMMPYLTIQP